MYGETFYGRHTAQHQLQWSQIKIRNEILERISSYRADRKMVRRTDRRTDDPSQKICLPTLHGGDTIIPEILNP